MRAHGIQSGATLRAGTPGINNMNNNFRADGSAPADAESPGTVSVAVAGGGGDGEDDVVVLSTHSYVDDALAADPSQVIPAYGYHAGYGYPLHASQMDAMALSYTQLTLPT